MPATATAEAGQPQSWKRNNPMGSPIPGPHPLTSEWRRLQRKRKGEKTGGTLQLATRVEGDEAEDGYRAGRTTQRCSLLRTRSQRRRQHPRRRSFRGKQGWRRVWWTRATAVAARPERDGGNSFIWQEPGRPGSPAPKALESGRTYRPKRQPRDSPETSTSGSYHSNLEETSQHCESKTPQAETWGTDTRKMECFSIFRLSEEWRPSPPVERKKWPKKGGEARQGRQCLWPGTEGTRVITSKKIAKLDSFN